MHWISELSGLLRESEFVEPADRKGLASVIALLTGDPAGGGEVLLLKRSMHVETHKGQIGFPGGFWEVGDKTLLQTALRELEEEIGVLAVNVEIIGKLNPVVAGGNVQVYPWLAYLREWREFKLSANEVERLIFLPCQKLVEDGFSSVSISMGSFQVKGEGIPFDGEIIWGATARMLKQLRECLLHAAASR